MTRRRARRSLVALATLVSGNLGTLALIPAGANAAPTASATTTATMRASASAVAPACPAGPYQRQVEGYLHQLGGYGAVVVDGKQSSGDCAAIKKFQQRFGIVPTSGVAGPTTVDVAARLVATKTAACAAKSTGITFCVDLTHQTTWVMKNGKVLRAPTITRTGMNGFRTPAGTYKINLRSSKEWSDPYHVWLPYWQRFVGGIGFHQTTTYIHDKWRGSHGCINLLPQDAQAYWGIGRIGLTVKVFGQRPGT